MTCAMSEKGTCAKPKILATTHAPAEIPKVLMSTIGTWRFVQQKKADAELNGGFSTWVTNEADTSMPPKKFGKHL